MNTDQVENLDLTSETVEKVGVCRRRIDIEAVVRATPERFRARYRRVLDGVNSRKTAMDMKCAECVGFQDVANRVGSCTVERCPLWSFRPYALKTQRGMG